MKKQLQLDNMPDMIDEIVEVARAVHYEMSYLNHVSKSDVLSESSFKYPALEWLERIGGKEQVFFEKSHPVFFKRMTDISWLENGIWSYIEMKYVKEETAGPTEQQRYFDDLLRLIHIMVDNPSSNAYFIACGKTRDWNPCFQSLGMIAPDSSIPLEPYLYGQKKQRSPAMGYYTQWLSFEGADPFRSICTVNYSEFYTNFVERYKFKKDKGSHPKELKFYTELLWISDVDSLQSSCATAVWKIKLKK